MRSFYKTNNKSVATLKYKIQLNQSVNSKLFIFIQFTVDFTRTYYILAYL